MNDPIISIATIRRRARAAFDRGEPLSACVMHTWTDAYATWAAEYALADAEQLAARAPAAAPCDFAADCPTRMRAGDKPNGCSTVDQATCSVSVKRKRSPIGAGEEIKRVKAPYAATPPAYGSGPFAALGYQP